MNAQRTIVTGFFNIGRDKWSHFSRGMTEYLAHAQRNMGLNENMIIFIEEDMLSTVKMYREKMMHRTHIIVMKMEDLPKYSLKDRIKQIMESSEFQDGLACPSVPEVWNPNYVILMWSKIDLLYQAMELDPFASTHFCWLDFGIGDYAKIEQFPMKFNDKIKVLCRSVPQDSDLDRVRMCKSHRNRFAGGFITGRRDYLLGFILAVDQEMNKCLNLNVVDCDQTMYSNVYLQNKDKFDLYFGDWDCIITGY